MAANGKRTRQRSPRNKSSVSDSWNRSQLLSACTVTMPSCFMTDGLVFNSLSATINMRLYITSLNDNRQKDSFITLAWFCIHCSTSSLSCLYNSFHSTCRRLIDSIFFLLIALSLLHQFIFRFPSIHCCTQPISLSSFQNLCILVSMVNILVHLFTNVTKAVL